MHKLLIGAVVTALAAVPALAFATGTPAKPGRMNQVETRADLKSSVAKMFARLDANKDGSVTTAEIDSLEAKRVQKIEQKIEQRAAHFDPAKTFARLDSNKDGRLTKAEVEATLNAAKAAKRAGPGADRLFARADSNKDGVITLAELQAMPRPNFNKARMERRMDGMKGRLFGQADLNKDGKVTLAEAEQAATVHFDRADTNKDGKITPDERKALRQAMKGK